MIKQFKQDLILSRFPQDSGPVVLACIKKGYESEKIVSMLKQFSEEMNDQINVFIAYEDSWDMVRNELKLEGTPLFIFYYQGKEQCRFLGKIKSRYLQTAIKKILKSSKNKERI